MKDRSHKWENRWLFFWTTKRDTTTSQTFIREYFLFNLHFPLFTQEYDARSHGNDRLVRHTKRSQHGMSYSQLIHVTSHTVQKSRTHQDGGNDESFVLQRICHLHHFLRVVLGDIHSFHWIPSSYLQGKATSVGRKTRSGQTPIQKENTNTEWRSRPEWTNPFFQETRVGLFAQSTGLAMTHSILNSKCLKHTHRLQSCEGEFYEVQWEVGAPTHVVVLYSPRQSVYLRLKTQLCTHQAEKYHSGVGILICVLSFFLSLSAGTFPSSDKQHFRWLGLFLSVFCKNCAVCELTFLCRSVWILSVRICDFAWNAWKKTLISWQEFFRINNKKGFWLRNLSWALVHM